MNWMEVVFQELVSEPPTVYLPPLIIQNIHFLFFSCQSLRSKSRRLMGTDAFPGEDWARHKQQKALSQYELNQVRQDASHSYQHLLVNNVC